MKINKERFLLACQKLRAQANGCGPILGFTFCSKGEPFATTFDFDDKDAAASLCVDAFIDELIEAGDEQG